MGLGGPEPYLRSHTLGFGDLPMLHEIIGIRRCDYENPPKFNCMASSSTDSIPSRQWKTGVETPVR